MGLGKNSRSPGSERMQVHIDAILRLSNEMLTLRRELSHCFRRHPVPSRQQIETEAVEEAVVVCTGNSPRKEPHHPLANQSLAHV